MSQQNQPYPTQPWTGADHGQDDSPWAERAGQPGLGGRGLMPPASQFPSGDAGGYGATTPSTPTVPYGGGAPYGQPFPGPGAEPHGQASTQHYGAQPSGGQAQQYGQPTSQLYPPNPYGHPQYPVQPYGYPPAQRRPVWKTVLGILLAAWTALAALSLLSQSGSLISGAADRGVAYQIGVLIGLVLFVGLPGVTSWLLLRRKR